MFKIKKSYLIFISFIGFLLLITTLYGTFAFNSMTELSGDNYVVTLTESSEVVNLKANSGKTIFYRVTNTNKGKVNYGIAYKGSNVTVKVYSDYYEDIDGILDYGQSKFTELYIENNSSSENSVTISTVLGYENGGDLIVPNGYKLVTLKYYPLSGGKYFNGETDYVDMEYANQDFGNTITVGARFMRNGIKENSDNYDIVNNYEQAGFGLHWKKDANTLYWQIYSSSLDKYISVSAPITPEEWHTAIGIFDGNNNTMKLYIDGQLSATYSSTVSGGIKKSVMPIIIGGNPNPSGTTGNYKIAESFKGMISDVFVTREVLDADTIAKNFTNTFTYDENDSTYFYYHFD